MEQKSQGCLLCSGTGYKLETIQERCPCIFNNRNYSEPCRACNDTKFLYFYRRSTTDLCGMCKGDGVIDTIKKYINYYTKQLKK